MERVTIITPITRPRFLSNHLTAETTGPSQHQQPERQQPSELTHWLIGTCAQSISAPMAKSRQPKKPAITIGELTLRLRSCSASLSRQGEKV